MLRTKIKKNISSSRSAFTLAELLIVIAIILVLVGISVIAFSGVTKKARTAVCLHERRAVKTAYYLKADEEEYDVPEAKRGGVLIDEKNYNAACGGKCTVIYSEDNCRIIDITCSVHGGTTLNSALSPGNSTGLDRAELGVTAMLTAPEIFDIFKQYIDKRSGNVVIDSTGHNFAPDINIALARLGYTEMGYGLADLSNFDKYGVNYAELSSGWCVTCNKNIKPLRYELYWTDANLETTAAGNDVRYVRYLFDLSTNEIISKNTGTVTVRTKHMNSETVIINGVSTQMPAYTLNIIDPGTKTEDDEYGTSWNTAP